MYFKIVFDNVILLSWMFLSKLITLMSQRLKICTAQNYRTRKMTGFVRIEVPLRSILILSESLFLKSAWRHSVYYYYDKARNTPYFASWHLGDSLGVYRWPQCRYKRRFYKSHSRLSKITTGNTRCRNIRTMQNVTNRNLIDPNKSGTWG